MGYDSKEEKSICEHCEDVGHIKKVCLLNPASKLFKRMLKRHYLETVERNREKEVDSIQNKSEIEPIPYNPALIKIEEIVEIQEELCNQCWTYGCIVKDCIAQKYRNTVGSWKKSTPYYIKPKINYWDEETSDEETSDEETSVEETSSDKESDEENFEEKVEEVNPVPLTPPLAESGIKFTLVTEPVEITDDLELLRNPLTPSFVPLIDRSGSDRLKEEEVVTIKEREPIIRLIDCQSRSPNKELICTLFGGIGRILNKRPRNQASEQMMQIYDQEISINNDPYFPSREREADSVHIIKMEETVKKHEEKKNEEQN